LRLLQFRDGWLSKFYDSEAGAPLGQALCAWPVHNIERRGARPKINSDRKMLTATNDWVRVHPASPVETVAVL
jgi:hypothetical protein